MYLYNLRHEPSPRWTLDSLFLVRPDKKVPEKGSLCEVGKRLHENDQLHVNNPFNFMDQNSAGE